MTEQEEVKCAVHYAALSGYGQTLTAYHQRLTADLATERERLRVAWEAIENAPHTASCGVNHCGGCGYTQAMCLCSNIGNTYVSKPCNCWKSRALAQLSAPTVAKSATVQIGAPVQAEQKEWRVTFTILAGHPGVRQSIDTNNRPLIFSTEKEADDCIAGKMECSPQLYREPQDIRKLERTKAGEWQDAEAKEKADAGQ